LGNIMISLNNTDEPRVKRTRPRRKLAAKPISPQADNIAQTCQGRAPELTDATQRIILDAIERGHFLDVAASLAGVSRRTLNAWIARGRLGAPEDQPYFIFASMVELARARFIDRALRQIDEGINVRALMWRLEKLRPDLYGRRSTIVMHESHEAPEAPGASPLRPVENVLRERDAIGGRELTAHSVPA
jgi:hypothetical protein